MLLTFNMASTKLGMNENERQLMLDNERACNWHVKNTVSREHAL
jgi:hypothetical protein